MTLLTVKNVCERLQLSERKVRELIARGDLPAYKFDGSVRVMEGDLNEYISSRIIAKESRKKRLTLRFLKV